LSYRGGYRIFERFREGGGGGWYLVVEESMKHAFKKLSRNGTCCENVTPEILAMQQRINYND